MIVEMAGERRENCASLSSRGYSWGDKCGRKCFSDCLVWKCISLLIIMMIITTQQYNDNNDDEIWHLRKSYDLPLDLSKPNPSWWVYYFLSACEEEDKIANFVSPQLYITQKPSECDTWKVNVLLCWTSWKPQSSHCSPQMNCMPRSSQLSHRSKWLCVCVCVCVCAHMHACARASA